MRFLVILTLTVGTAACSPERVSVVGSSGTTDCTSIASATGGYLVPVRAPWLLAKTAA